MITQACKMCGGPLDGEVLSRDPREDRFQLQAREAITIFESWGPGRVVPGPWQAGWYIRDTTKSDTYNWHAD